MLREESILEVADDVLVGDVGDGGARLEKTPVYDLRVSFITCLTWDRLWRVPALIMDPWKLSMKARLRSSHESMEFDLRLSSQVRARIPKLPGSRVLWWSWTPLRLGWQRSSIESTGAGPACHHTWGFRLV
jgi:hypothetical protein